MQPTNFSPNAASSPHLKRALAHMLTYTHIVISRRVVAAMRQETALAPRLQNAATAAAQSRIAFSAIESGQKASHATTFQHLFNPGAHAGILYLSLKQSCHSISCFEPACMCVCVMSDCVGRALRRSNNSQQLARHIRIDLLRPLSLTSLAGSQLAGLLARTMPSAAKFTFPERRTAAIVRLKALFEPAAAA